MSEAMREALADKAELPPFELGQAAALLPHSTAAQAPALVNAAPAPAPSPPVLEASAAPSVPRRPDCPASRSRHSPHSGVSITTNTAATPTGYAALQLARGKLIAAPAVTHTSPSPSGAPLIYLKDRRTNTSYLVHIGAAVSLLPYSSPLYPC